MKILIIPDLHGNPAWKTMVAKNPNCLTVFLGDYCDHYTRSNHQIYNNLWEVIEFKKKNPDRIILLLGNHDLQYFFPSYIAQVKCSGFRPELFLQLSDLFFKNKDLFLAAYQINNILFSHAGLVEDLKIDLIRELSNVFTQKELKALSYADIINLFFLDKPIALFGVGFVRGGRFADIPGPFWADQKELSYNPALKINQIVGHSKVPSPKLVITKDSSKLFFTDTLDYGNKYLILNLKNKIIKYKTYTL